MSIYLVCVHFWKLNTIFRTNIVLNVKFHFAGELRSFAQCVCVCVCIEFWDYEKVCKQSRTIVK